MINLHERLSEFSYGFGVTREVQAALEGVGLRPTPFLPNLLHEEELGFYVGFKDRGRVVVLQFKLGDELERFRRTSPSQSIPTLDRPFWRFTIDTSGLQFQGSTSTAMPRIARTDHARQICSTHRPIASSDAPNMGSGFNLHIVS